MQLVAVEVLALLVEMQHQHYALVMAALELLTQ
jgi:hypothetical protein